MNKLFITRIQLNKDTVPSFRIYPFNIKVVKNFDKLDFKSPVTFFIGENGVGKSTFIEAIAVAMGLNAEGGSQNFRFTTKNTTSELYKYLKISKLFTPKTKYFLRAESFYNVATEVEKLDSPYSLHNCSHGESFITTIANGITENGLYILDEPEAALSPSRQLTLLCLIDELVNKGCQFIISTHSPILISYKKGVILDLDNNFEETDYFDTEIYKTYKMFLDDPYRIQEKLYDYDE